MSPKNVQIAPQPQDFVFEQIPSTKSTVSGTELPTNNIFYFSDCLDEILAFVCKNNNYML